MDWDKAGISTLREALDWISQEARAAKRTKRELSHELAKDFLHILGLEPSTRIIERPRGNANYFSIEINGTLLAVTPFGSHDEWWESLAKAFGIWSEEEIAGGVLSFLLSLRRKGYGLKASISMHMS